MLIPWNKIHHLHYKLLWTAFFRINNNLIKLLFSPFPESKITRRVNSFLLSRNCILYTRLIENRIAEDWIHDIINRPLILPLCLLEPAENHRYRGIRNVLYKRLTTFEYTSVTALLTKLRYTYPLLFSMYLSFYVQENWICNDIATSDLFHRFAHRAV